MTECWRCGRAVDEMSATGERYVFGVICSRRECRQVKAMLSNCHKVFWFRASLPGPDSMGRVASYTHGGEMNHQQAMSDPGMNRAMEIDRNAQRGRYA